jgi:hypothetical protein
MASLLALGADPHPATNRTTAIQRRLAFDVTSVVLYHSGIDRNSNARFIASVDESSPGESGAKTAAFAGLCILGMSC